MERVLKYGDRAEKGERVAVSKIQGYKLVQDRPYACNRMCVCGECYGQTVLYPGTVEKTIAWGDGAIEIRVLCDDGVTRGVETKVCNLDPC